MKDRLRNNIYPANGCVSSGWWKRIQLNFILLFTVENEKSSKDSGCTKVFRKEKKTKKREEVWLHFFALSSQDLCVCVCVCDRSLERKKVTRCACVARKQPSSDMYGKCKYMKSLYSVSRNNCVKIGRCGFTGFSAHGQSCARETQRSAINNT